MQTIQEIITDLNLTDSDIERLSNEARSVSINCGKEGVVKDLASVTWDLFDQMSDKIWYSELTNLQKITLGFQFYETFPSYHHFLVPFYNAIRNKEIIDQPEKDIIWEHFMNYLASENYYADPVGYALWVEFFEDQSTVLETWDGLMKFYDKKAMLRLLEQSGPVPYDLKAQVYKILIQDTDSHQAIFKSLLFSAYDLYGQISKGKAKDLLKQLNVDRTSENYKLLVNKLN